jgi:CheY-like chemotaxis protein
MSVGIPADHGAALQGKRILVVEDEAIVAMLLEDVLLDAGARIVGPAVSIGDALELIETVMADGGLSAAVLDIDLDGKVVTPVADRLAALGVPFLFATGYGESCDTAGHRASPVLHKPFIPHELILAVEFLVSAGARSGLLGHSAAQSKLRSGGITRAE